jgi:hypothetical protein
MYTILEHLNITKMSALKVVKYSKIRKQFKNFQKNLKRYLPMPLISMQGRMRL